MSGTTPRPELRMIDSTAAIRLRMQEQSLRAPWHEVAAAAQQIVEYLALALWVRASVASNMPVPALVRREIDTRCPGFFSSQSSDASMDDLWTDILEWANFHRISAAQAGGWMEAAHYYAGRDPRSELYWRHWEQSSGQTSEFCGTPCPFEQWKSEATTGSGIPEVAVLEKVIQTEAFALWVSLIVERGGRYSDLESALRTRCPQPPLPNLLPRRGDQAALNRLRQAILNSMLASDPKAEAAIHQARDHLRYERVVAYFEHCSRTWRLSPNESIPSFESWLKAADEYIVRA